MKLQSVHGDATVWPKKGMDQLGIKGGVQYSWSNIGFPYDPRLEVRDLEDSLTEKILTSSSWRRMCSP